MKKYLFILYVLVISKTYSQTVITGSIDVTDVISSVERNFVGFNSGPGYMETIYNKGNSSANLDVNAYLYSNLSLLNHNVYFRFPGGTVSDNYYRWYAGYGYINIFGIDAWADDGAYLPSNISSANRDTKYGSYANYTTTGFTNAKSNVIFPFINSVTDDLSSQGRSSFVVSIVNHFRNYGTYNTRNETLTDSAKIKNIRNLQDFRASTLSAEFKKIVNQNIDAYITLVKNNVYADKIEFGNELYSRGINTTYNNFKNSIADKCVWINDGTAGTDASRSLWVYAQVARMYKALLLDTMRILQLADGSYTNLYNNMRFGIPVSNDLNGGFSIWNNFFLRQQTVDTIGNEAFILHPYCDSVHYFKGDRLSASNYYNIDTLTAEFNNIRDSIQIAYKNRNLLDFYTSYMNQMPSGSEVWFTEWNLNFDRSNYNKVGNTLLHAMFCWDVLMSFFDLNANKNLASSCSLTNPVKLCNYHSSHKNGTDETWYTMLRFPAGYSSTNINDALTTTNSVTNDVRYNASYYMHSLIYPVIDDDNYDYVDNTNGGFSATTNCDFRTFVKTYSGVGCNYKDVYIYFNNKSATDYQISLTSALSGILGSHCIEQADYKYLHATNLFASMGKTTFRSSDDITTDSALTIIYKTGTIPSANYGGVLIQKYATGYIHISLKAETESCNCGGEDGRIKNNFAGTKTILNDNSVYVYPNPSKDIFHFEFSNEDVSKVVEIFDLNGKLLKTITANKSIDVNLSSLASGDYMYRVTMGTNKTHGKLILH